MVIWIQSSNNVGPAGDFLQWGTTTFVPRGKPEIQTCDKPLTGAQTTLVMNPIPAVIQRPKCFSIYHTLITLLQVRDEFRQDYDPGRGGFGKILKAEVDSMTAQMEEGLQGYAMTAPMQGEGGKRRRSGGAGGRGDPSLQAPEQAEEEEEQPIVVHQPGSDNEQE